MINIFPIKIQLSQTMKKIQELDILILNFYFYIWLNKHEFIWHFFITRIIAASSDIILLRPLNHIINLIYVINTRSIRMLEFYSHKGQNEFNLKIS